jgi:hypothetical protein
METKSQKLKEIRKSKQEEYGTDFGVAMNDIGHLWSVLLGLDTAIPGYMVANMYVAAKLYRTKHKFKKDTYDDAANYLQQAEEMHQAEEEIIFNTDGIVKDQVDK